MIIGIHVVLQTLLVLYHRELSAIIRLQKTQRAPGVHEGPPHWPGNTHTHTQTHTHMDMTTYVHRIVHRNAEYTFCTCMAQINTRTHHSVHMFEQKTCFYVLCMYFFLVTLRETDSLLHQRRIIFALYQWCSACVLSK